jgi:predicted TIM-barrel fold metal-dependent hydrolase
VIAHAGAAWGSLNEKYSEPLFWEGMLKAHPDTNLVLAHLGGRWRFQVMELCQRFDNCYTDISALQGWLPSDPDTALLRLREVADKVPDRASFASDFPLFDLSYESMQWARFVREQPWADEDIKAKVLGGNICKVLGI